LEPPFTANNSYALGNKIVNEPHKPVSDFYSKELKTIIDLLLSKNPKDRPTSDNALKLLFKESQDIFSRNLFINLKFFRN